MNEQQPTLAPEPIPVPDSIPNNHQVWEHHDGLLTAESRANHSYKEHPHPADAGYVLETEPDEDEKQRGIAYTETELAGKPFVIAERPGSKPRPGSEADINDASAPTPEPEPAPEPAPASWNAPAPKPGPGPSSRPEHDPGKSENIIFFNRGAAGMRRFGQEYSTEGTELRSSEELSEIAPTIIRTKTDEHGGSRLYFAPKGLRNGAVVDVNSSLDQGKLVYLTPLDSHVEDGKLVGDGPGYYPDEPYLPVTIGKPWVVGGALTEPIEAVQVSKGFIPGVRQQIPNEQRRGADKFDELIKFVNDLQREQDGTKLGDTQKMPMWQMPPRPAPAPPEMSRTRKILAGITNAKEQMTERTKQMAGRLAERLGNFTDTAYYLGNIALIETAYRAGNAKSGVAYHAGNMADRTAERVGDLTHATDYLGNIALINTASLAGNARSGVAYHAGNVADSVSAFIQERLRRSSGKDDTDEDGTEGARKNELDVDIVSRKRNWDWDADVDWEDDWD